MGQSVLILRLTSRRIFDKHPDMAIKSAKKTKVISKAPARSPAKGSTVQKSNLKKAATVKKASPVKKTSGVKKAVSKSKTTAAKVTESKKIQVKPSKISKPIKPVVKEVKNRSGVASAGKEKLKQIARSVEKKKDQLVVKGNESQKPIKDKEVVKKAVSAPVIDVKEVDKQKTKTKKTPTPVFDDVISKEEDYLPPILTDAEGRPYCKVKDCDQVATVEGYCRFHYLLLWKKIQVRRRILMDGKLERYVEELTARYPDKFLDVIRKDLLSEKNFMSAIAELEIDESNTESDFEEEDTQSIEEVRSFSDSGLIGDDEF